MCLFSSSLSYTLHHHHSQLLRTLIYFHCCEDASSFGGMRTEALRDQGPDGVCLQLNLLTLEQHTQVCWSSLFPSISSAGIVRIYMPTGEKRATKGTWNLCQCVSVTGLQSDEQKKSKDDPRITRLQVVPVHNRQYVPKALQGASCCYRLRRTHQRIFSHPSMVHRFCFPRTEPMWEHLSHHPV